jgi:hypothetical protein
MLDLVWCMYMLEPIRGQHENGFLIAAVDFSPGRTAICFATT